MYFRCSGVRFSFSFLCFWFWEVLPIAKFHVLQSHSSEVTQYNDVIMNTMASQITSLTIVYSTVYSGADQRKHQSFASLAFVRGIPRGPVNSPHKGPVTRKMFPFDDVVMTIWISAKLHSSTYVRTVIYCHNTMHNCIMFSWHIGCLVAHVFFIEQAMACRLFGATPLPAQMLAHCEWNSFLIFLETNFIEISTKYEHSISRKSIWKSRLRNVGHFVRVSTCSMFTVSG